MGQKKTPTEHVTIQDVARAAGTSPSSVSRVLTGNANVSEEKRKAILSVIEKTSYRPNLIARSLKTRSTQFIGLIISDILNPFYGALVRGAEDRASESGYALILCNTNESADVELADIRLLKDKLIDGIIVAPSGANSEILQQCVGDGIYVVQVDRFSDAVASPAVILDNFQAAFTATQHLLHEGHTHIAFVGYALGQMTMVDRERGFRAAFEASAIELKEEDVIHVEFSVESITSQLVTKLSGANRPNAIFAANNRITMAVLSALQELNLAISRDISVVAFDDLPVFSLLSPPLSAVAQPAYDMGARCVDLLLGQINGSLQPPFQPTIFNAELKVRQSSRKM
jgi:DNA-binding LacI/PurR family transcriptional regulator